jgi:MinD-like ATPase involved in chromosome partitioning or flagellar assembly
MSSSASNRTPKSLADVSHLFFSSTEEEPLREAAELTDTPLASAVEPAAPEAHDSPPDAEADLVGRWERTKLFVVTGGDSGPGKSTVAVNLAYAFTSTGSVGVFDADPKIPNARFYMGAPSWNYLSPLVGEGRAAPTVRVDSGIVAVDCTGGGGRADEFLGRGESVYVDVDGDGDGNGNGRERLSCAVIDLAIGRAAWLAPVLDRIGLFVVVARPGWSGFSEAFAVLARLRRDLGVREVGLTVNMSPDNDYAARFFSKTRVAAERLLSMDVHFLGGMVYEDNLGREQRERGSIVRSRPDAVFALMLREAASKALGSEWSRVAPLERWKPGTEI